ncbi:hypothetical protein T484DRAFT_1747755 [Baffinella frigidus]|nr:hypothetical protein T484DRAFT_1747755 [Cryptophyta sp. CCMP2293]
MEDGSNSPPRNNDDSLVLSPSPVPKTHAGKESPVSRMAFPTAPAQFLFPLTGTPRHISLSSELSREESDESSSADRGPAIPLSPPSTNSASAELLPTPTSPGAHHAPANGQDLDLMGDVPYGTPTRPRVHVAPQVISVLAGLEREKAALQGALDRSRRELEGEALKLREERAVTRALEDEVRRLVQNAASSKEEGEEELSRVRAEHAAACRQVGERS